MEETTSCSVLSRDAKIGSNIPLNNHRHRRLLPLLAVMFIFASVIFFFVDQQPGLLLPQETQHQQQNQYKNGMEEINEKNSAETKTGTSLPPKSGMTINLPNVLLAGAQKAGTSTLYAWLLRGSAQICSAKVFEGEPPFFDKEVHFYDKEERYEQGLPFYAKRFEHCYENGRATSKHAVVIDATPATCLYANRVRDIYQQQQQHQRYDQGSQNGSWAEKLKVLMILREPVSQELSAYNHMSWEYLRDPNPHDWYGRVANKTFDEYMDTVVIPGMQSRLDKNLLRDMYAKILTEWVQEQSFPREQLLVLSYDEMKNNPVAYMRRVQDFLGIKIDGDLPHNNENSFAGKVQLPSCAVQARFAKAMGPMNQELYALLEKNTGPAMEQRPFPPFQLGECVE